MRALPDIGVGILSWKGYGSLRAALETYREQDFLSAFAERHIFLPEAEDEGRQLAAAHRLTLGESADNLGILGGFDALVSQMTAPYVLLLENDLQLTVPVDTALEELHRGLRLLQNGTCQVIRMRNRKRPGKPMMGLDQYLRFYPQGPDGAADRALKIMRRTVRPYKARRLATHSLYAFEDPSSLHPDVIRRDPETGFFVVSSRYINWSNLAILIERRFFIEKVLGFAKANPSRRGVNGFQNIEIEMNSPYWRSSGWHVGTGDGIFTHIRLGDRGY